MRDYDVVQPIMDSIRSRYPGVLFLLMPHGDGTVELLRLAIPRESRSQGVGTRVMEDLVSWADENRKLLWLQVAERDPKSGTTSRNRLIRFYERFGFVRNKGRNLRYDLSLYVQMYREPMERKSLGNPISKNLIERISEFTDWDVGDQGHQNGFLVISDDGVYVAFVEGWGYECADAFCDSESDRARIKALGPVAEEWLDDFRSRGFAARKIFSPGLYFLTVAVAEADPSLKDGISEEDLIDLRDTWRFRR
jgi:hypothetical protein